MKCVLVLLAVFGYASCQQIHGHELKDLVHNGFVALDTNHDGILEMNEYEAVIKAIDKNGDGQLSCDEYVNYFTHQPRALSLEIFHHLDSNGDCLASHDDAVGLLALMDQSGDQQVTAHEYEHYYTNIMHHLGHVNHGHHG